MPSLLILNSVMKLSWILALICCIVSACRAEYGDKEYLEKQKDLLVVLKYVHQPLWNTELFNYAKSYVISEDYVNYNNVEPVKEFVKLIERKTLLEKRAIFSIYNPVHLKQAKSLFYVFYNAKNYETLSHVIAWARFNVNEKMFMYVLGLTQVHRKDLETLIMPPPYEMCPFQFINGEVIKQAQRVAMQGFYDAKKVDGYREVVIKMNYTGWTIKLNDDQKLTYLTEDPTWNSMYYNYHLNYPFWLGGKEFGLDKDRRGEIFISVHQYNVARYYLERLSNDLGEIENFNWRKPIKSGYHPMLMLVNGVTLPTRDNFHSLYDDLKMEDILHAEDHERRIRNIIEKGYYYVNGKKVFLYEPEIVNMMGNLIQGNEDSTVDHKFISRLSVPKFLENPATAARDPLYYQYYNYILNIFWKFMSHNIEPYKKDEVNFPGVEIKDVEFGKIETFFEEHDIDITNALEVPPDSRENNEQITKIDFKPDDVFVKARYQRLNYKPFEMKFNVHSDKSQTAYMRIFIGPRDESLSPSECFEKHRKYYYIVDSAVVDLKTGDNLIVREVPGKFDRPYSQEQTSYFELYKKIVAAQSGQKWPRQLHKGRCGVADHLRFPRGKIGGMKYQILTIIKSIKLPIHQNYDSTISCGVGSGLTTRLNSTLLFPIDRNVNPLEFYVPNLNLHDIEIEFKPAY